MERRPYRYAGNLYASPFYGQDEIIIPHHGGGCKGEVEIATAVAGRPPCRLGGGALRTTRPTNVPRLGGALGGGVGGLDRRGGKIGL